MKLVKWNEPIPSRFPRAKSISFEWVWVRGEDVALGLRELEIRMWEGRRYRVTKEPENGGYRLTVLWPWKKKR